MSLVSKWNAANMAVGGSSQFDVFLSDSEAQNVYKDPSATAGWYRFSYLEGGTYGEEFQAEGIRDEGGTLLRNTATADDFVISNGAMQATSEVHRLFNILKGSNHKYRYILPIDPDADPDRMQVIGVHNGLMDKSNWTSNTTEGSVRMMPFVVRGTRTATTPKYVVEEVDDVAVEAEWPTDLADFKTDPLEWSA